MNGDIYLRHGTMNDSEVSGNKVEVAARIVCTSAATVKVRALTNVGSNSATVNLSADGSLQSMLNVNGVIGNGGVVVDVPEFGGKEVMFSSVLIARGLPPSGSFTGSAVAVLDII
jgi:hypothetical protein